MDRSPIISRMRANNTATIIIDLQDKLLRSIENRSEIIWNVQRIIKASDLLGLQVFFTEQNPEKLGETIDEIKVLTSKAFNAKLDFSCATCNEIIEGIEDLRIENLLICGIESHVCVQQTVLDLLIRKFKVFVPIDAIGSRKRLDHEVSIERMRDSGATITTTESTLFEWCETSNRKEFKSISRLIKDCP